MHISKEDGRVLIDSGLESDMFNIICASSDITENGIEACIEHFQERGLPFCCWVGFDQDSELLKSTLNDHQLFPSEEELMMLAKTEQVNWESQSQELNIERVQKREHIEHLIEVICGVVNNSEHQAMRTFFSKAGVHLINPQSDLKFFLGYVDNQPVACSSVFFSQGVASIFDVMVSHSQRGRGLGKAMTLAAMKEGADSGYQELLLTATDGAKYLYEKLGFKPIKMMSVFS